MWTYSSTYKHSIYFSKFQHINDNLIWRTISYSLNLIKIQIVMIFLYRQQTIEIEFLRKFDLVA